MWCIECLRYDEIGRIVTKEKSIEGKEILLILLSRFFKNENGFLEGVYEYIVIYIYMKKYMLSSFEILLNYFWYRLPIFFRLLSKSRVKSLQHILFYFAYVYFFIV